MAYTLLVKTKTDGLQVVYNEHNKPEAPFFLAQQLWESKNKAYVFYFYDNIPKVFDYVQKKSGLTKEAFMEKLEFGFETDCVVIRGNYAYFADPVIEEEKDFWADLMDIITDDDNGPETIERLLKENYNITKKEK